MASHRDEEKNQGNAEKISLSRNIFMTFSFAHEHKVCDY